MVHEETSVKATDQSGMRLVYNPWDELVYCVIGFGEVLHQMTIKQYSLTCGDEARREIERGRAAKDGNRW